MALTERELDRLAHPAPCTTNPNGTRQNTPEPKPQDIIRNFGHTTPPNDPRDWLPAPTRSA